MTAEFSDSPIDSDYGNVISYFRSINHRRVRMKVTFDLALGRISVDGDAPELLQVVEAARLLAPNVKQIQITTSAVTADETPNAQSTSPAASNQDQSKRTADPSRMTMRQFARTLALNNAPERIAAIAYYVNKIEGRQSFSPRELDGWFTMCGFQKPAQMPVALFDTKRKYGYAENIGRGMWRISTQGENLILRKLEERDSDSP
jgi:hypothetical protein